MSTHPNARLCLVRPFYSTFSRKHNKLIASDGIFRDLRGGFFQAFFPPRRKRLITICIGAVISPPLRAFRDGQDIGPWPRCSVQGERVGVAIPRAIVLSAWRMGHPRCAMGAIGALARRLPSHLACTMASTHSQKTKDPAGRRADWRSPRPTRAPRLRRRSSKAVSLM